MLDLPLPLTHTYTFHLSFSNELVVFILKTVYSLALVRHTSFPFQALCRSCLLTPWPCSRWGVEVGAGLRGLGKFCYRYISVLIVFTDIKPEGVTCDRVQGYMGSTVTIIRSLLVIQSSSSSVAVRLMYSFVTLGLLYTRVGRYNSKPFIDSATFIIS